MASVWHHSCVYYPYNGQWTADNGQTKKERRGLDRASTLLRTAERSAGLGDTCFRVAVFFGAVFAFCGHPIALTKPAAQVDEPATLTAEWKARRVSRVATSHFLTANRTGYVIHRNLSHRTRSFSLSALHYSTPYRCLSRRLCRLYRSCPSRPASKSPDLPWRP